ncbi:hypothetical protein ONZ45_g2857 [Pleurotus djamor]|nr:hypothetical protein ONZ45_g2857 [Pleurotus djamor]
MESIDLGISKWIWTGENALPAAVNPAGPRTFRKTFASPCGKCAISTKVLITAENSYKLYINGHLVGSGSNFTSADVHYSALKSRSNLFAIEAVNNGGTAGVIATILIQYSDGTSERIITDESWRTFIGSPKDFESPQTDDVNWGFAALQGKYGVKPWGKPTKPPAMSLVDVPYIWTGKISLKTAIAEKGSKALRKTWVTPGCTKRAVAANVVLNVDNELAFFVNGVKVEWRQHWWIGRAYYIPPPVLDPDVNIFAINGTNGGGHAHLIAKIHMSYDDGSYDIITTDETWKANSVVADNFADPDLDDSTWVNATRIGVWGRWPWKYQIKIPKA